jgi:hypothetical protein
VTDALGTIIQGGELAVGAAIVGGAAKIAQHIVKDDGGGQPPKK